MTRIEIDELARRAEPLPFWLSNNITVVELTVVLCLEASAGGTSGEDGRQNGSLDKRADTKVIRTARWINER
jgi:hypothetical protein